MVLAIAVSRLREQPWGLYQHGRRCIFHERSPFSSGRVYYPLGANSRERIERTLVLTKEDNKVGWEIRSSNHPKHPRVPLAFDSGQPSLVAPDGDCALRVHVVQYSLRLPYLLDDFAHGSDCRQRRRRGETGSGIGNPTNPRSKTPRTGLLVPMVH